MDEHSLPTASDWMTPSPLDLRPDDELFAALEGLVKHRASAAPVLGPTGQLLGMLTEKDCLRVLSSFTYDGDAQEGTVADYLSPVRIVVEPTMDLFRVAEIFLGTNFPVLPVVSSGRLVGLISRQAMLQGILDLRARLLRNLAQAEAQAGRQADRPRSIEHMQQVFASARNRDQLVRLIGRQR